MLKRIRILAVSAMLAAFAAQSGAYAAVAPLNPDFIEYMNRAKRSASTLSAATDAASHVRGGYVPSPLNWSHLDGRTWSVRSGGDEATAARSAAASELPAYYLSGENTAQLPGSYDLREKMPAVRDQTGFNNCWTYSAMAATESNLIMKGLADTSIELSEWYLTYYLFLPCGDMPGFTKPTDKKYYEVGGDNNWSAVALLSRGTGSVSAEKVPNVIAEYDADTGKYDYSAVYEPPITARDWKLQNALYLGNLGKREVQLSEERRDMIKRAIMEHGAVSVTYSHDQEWYNDETSSYYSISSYNENANNHAVALVGWDDGYSKNNFESEPDNDGAWIARNSWGNEWGDGGYFYISYEENSLCDGVAYDTVAALNGERIYQYDPLGCVGWYKPDESSQTLYFANVFMAEGDDNISSVAFYVPDDRISYEVRVYTGCGDSPVSGTLAATKTVSSLVPGYNTVELDEPAAVKMGARFSVVVMAQQNSADAYEYMVPIECYVEGYSEDASANPGEGWVSADGENFVDILEASSQYENVSICLKAFGESVSSSSSSSSSGGCNAGTGALALLVLLPFALRRRK